MTSSPLAPEAYAIGIICALFEEKAAVETMLDERHEALAHKLGDTNTYTFGKIGKHNVVVACLQEGYQGKAAATAVAVHMTRSFPIKLGLMVGIGGGVPSQIPDVRLGDVVVSRPVGERGGVVQYDLGKMESDGIIKKGHLDKPPKALLGAITSLRTKHEQDDPTFPEYLSAIDKKPRMASKYGFQGSENDELFEDNQLVVRKPRTSDLPQVFYGTIGSGDLVMKNSAERDRLASADKIFCFEMEAAGLMNDFPCLIIRGISDYADSRKNDRWQPYAAATAAAYAKELLGAVNVEEVAELGPAIKHLVPFSLKGVPAIDHFVQRNENMQKLEDFFLGQTSHLVRRKKFVVHGLGGIGKTQICIDFARKHHEGYTAVFWMDGSSEDALRQSFANVISLLPSNEISQALKSGKASTEAIVEGVLGWMDLPSNNKWLHIIDNVDHDHSATVRDPLSYDLTKYLAQADHGSILITSRLSTLTWLGLAPANSLQLTGMNAEESRSLFEVQSGRSTIGLHADESADLDRLFHKLEGMPLALAQAGAYIRHANISIHEYLEYYESTWDDLIAEQDIYPLPEYAQGSMLTTWTISYQRVECQRPEAANILKLWAFLDPKDMWYELLACAMELQSQIQIPEWLSTLAKSRFNLRSAFAILKKYSLVNDGTDSNYSMHAVLHSWCRHLASMDSVDEAFPELAASIIAQMTPDVSEGSSWILERRLFPHGQQLLSYLRLGTPWRISHISAEAYESVAMLLACNHANKEAAELLESAVEEKERRLGQDHPSTLTAMRSLAFMYSELYRDRPTKSEELYKRALAICEKKYRRDHTNSQVALYLMSNLLLGLGNHYAGHRLFEKGEDMYKRALEVCDQHSDVPRGILHEISLCLATIYYQQRRFPESEEMLQRALSESIEIYGSAHYCTFKISSRLTKIYYILGKTTQGEKMLKRTAAVYHKKFSGKHDFTDLYLDMLPLYQRQGNYAEAAVMVEQARAEFGERFGLDHVTTLRASSQLAFVYCKLADKLQEARTLLEELIPRVTMILGLGDPITQLTIETLGLLYCKKLNMLSRAEELFEHHLRRYETVLGPNDKATIHTLESMAFIYKLQGDKTREVEMHRRALVVFKNKFGQEHQGTIRAALRLDLALQLPYGFFFLTSQDITLDSDWNLVAFCRRADGSWIWSTLSLNDTLKNVCGHFSWGGSGNLVATARNMTLEGHGSLLAADLEDDHGDWNRRSIPLDERISNEDGKLTFLYDGNRLQSAAPSI